MRIEPEFTSILKDYRRIAVIVAILVVIVVIVRLLTFFGLAPARLVAITPIAGLGTATLLIGTLVVGHIWLSTRLCRVAEDARAQRALLHRDALTGVFNRAYFIEALSAEVRLDTDRPVGYLQLDMDNLKQLNDSSGHGAGDAALVHLGQTIQAVMPDAIVGRLGGDEFGIMIVGLNDKAALRRLGNELLRQLDHPVMIAGSPVRLSASIGAAIAPHDASDPVDLISKADLALYKGKKNGRRAVVAFDPDMLGEERQRRFIERELRAAVMMDELELHYQPVFGPDMAVRSYEALVRWRHTVRGMIPPSQFIPVAEKSDLIDKLGEWVLRRVCADLPALRGVPVAINVSPAQLRQPDFAERFEAFLLTLETTPDRLIVEITETVPLEAGRVELDNLARLRAAGVRIAIDDFGAGHASLQYLRSFAFDIIKIDRSYVANLGANRVDAMIVSAICDIALALPVDVVAEGIETPEQLVQLRLAGCTGFQGFLLGHPAPLATLLPPPAPKKAAGLHA